MSAVSKTTLKSYFNTGDKPTESNFTDLIDSSISSLTYTPTSASDYVAGSNGETTLIMKDYYPNVELPASGIPEGTIYTIMTGDQVLVGSAQWSNSATHRDLSSLGFVMSGFAIKKTTQFIASIREENVVWQIMGVLQSGTDGDGWGNDPKPNIANDRLQRWTLSEQEYTDLTSASPKILATATNQSEEDAYFAEGYIFVLRTDLIP